MSRFLKEIPQELLEGYEDAFKSTSSSNSFGDSPYKWTYGGNTTGGKIKTYSLGEKEPAVAASSAVNNNGFQFRTAESFLSKLTSKKNTNVDLYQYKEGQRVFHKKFGEGTINVIEPEGEDLKVDISFDKVGHKRLMAKFAGLEIIN